MLNKYNSRLRRSKKAKAMIKKSGRPRLVVHRSSQHIYGQIIVPTEQGDTVLVSCSSIEKSVREQMTGNKLDCAFQVGKILGQRAKEKKLDKVAFDRSGYKYHGRVAALAKGAREALDF